MRSSIACGLTCALACGLVLEAPRLARGAPALRAPADAAPGDLVASPMDGGAAVLARQLVIGDASAGGTGRAQSRILYLNHEGITVTPGANDSRANRSSLVDRPRTVPPWRVDAATWSATRACVADLFARFAVTVTDEDPGTELHIEAVIGGSPQDLGLPVRAGGVSPFSTSCGTVEGSIVFVFPSVLPQDVQRICEVTAQEISHSYGLDHELLASDPMTYLRYGGKRTFQDRLASCGESTPRSCGIGSFVCRDLQNSVALLRERIGVPDAVPPRVAITAPADGAAVAAAFAVSITASDDVGVAEAALYVDGEQIATRDAPGPGTFELGIDAPLPPGPHAIEVIVTDGQNEASAAIRVAVRGGGGAGFPLPGCAAGGGGGGGGGVLVGPALLVVLLRRRRRGRRCGCGCGALSR